MTPKNCVLTLSLLGDRIFIYAKVLFGFWQLSDRPGFFRERS